jgi:hypothetical protein
MECKKALNENGWVRKIKKDDLTVAHIEQFVKLWSKLQTFQLIEDLEDGISLTLLTSGQCSAAFAYKAQFFGAISTDMNKMVWKI